MASKKNAKKSEETTSYLLPILIGIGGVCLLCVCGGAGLGVAWLAPWKKAEPLAQIKGDAVAKLDADKERPPEKEKIAPKKTDGDTEPNPPKKEVEVDPRDIVRLPETRVELPAHLHAKEKPYLVLDPNGHSAVVTRVMLSPDSRHVITASHDRTVRVWEVATGDMINTFRLPVGAGNEGAIFAAALSPDGTKLAVSGVPVGKGKLGVFIYLIDMQTGQIEKTLTGHRNYLGNLAFSPNGQLLASASHDNSVRLWNVQAGTMARELPHSAGVRQATFAPNGKQLLTLTTDHHVYLWNVATGEKLKELKTPPAPFISAAWSPDSSTIATGSVDGKVQTWSADGTPRKQMTILPGRNIQPATIAFLNENKVVYGGVEAKGETGVLNVQTGQCRDVPLHDNTVVHLNLSSDRKLVVSSGGDDHETIVWRAADGTVVQQLKGTGRVVFGVGWSRDAKSVAWGNTNRGSTQLAQPPLERSFNLEQFEFGPNPTPGPAFVRLVNTIDGYTLKALDFFQVAISHEDKQVHVWKSPAAGDRVYSFTLLPGAKAVMGTAFSMYLVDLKTNKIAQTFDGHSGSVLGVSLAPNGRYFASAALDQTVRIWRPDQKEPLVSFFFTGNDWIAWTPDGYYASSANGERLMGWQVNLATDRLGKFYPAAYFRASMYKPDALKFLIQTGDMTKALALADKGNANATKIAQVLPPAVEITSPDRTSVINKRKLEVKAIARSVGSNPVTALRLLVDGRPYQGDKSIRRFADAKVGDAEAVWTVDLSPGKHLLAVLAESPVSKSLSSIREVTVDGVGKDELPNLYMVSVGISEYAGPMALRFAAKDAIVLEKTLREKTTGVFNKVETKLITDKQATRKEIEAGLKWLETKMTANDVGIIFFAGHGARDLRGRFYLVPVDVNERNFEASCVSGDLVKKSLAAMPGKLIAMLDACHSGSIAEKNRGRADDLVRDLVSEEYGVVCMCSSLGREYSMESSEVAHGFFTLGVVEGLTGKADFNRDGYVYIHEADFFANRRVRELSQGSQNPVTGRPPNIRSFPLSRP